MVRTRKIYIPPGILINGYCKSRKQHDDFLDLCRRKKLPRQKGYGVRPYIRYIVKGLVVWVLNKNKLPYVVFMDLTIEQNRKLTARLKNDISYIDNLVKNDLFNGGN